MVYKTDYDRLLAECNRRGMALAMIAGGHYQGDVQEFAQQNLVEPQTQESSK